MKVAPKELGQAYASNLLKGNDNSRNLARALNLTK